MKLSGLSIIGFRQGVVGGTDPFYAFNPATGEPLKPGFAPATAGEIDLAARLAHQAFASYSRVSGKGKATFLRVIAAKIESVAAEIIDRAEQETALAKPRLQGEIARTCGQLRLFAQSVEDGSWVMARIDRGDPDRKPSPRPDIRSMLRPLGPVVVFGASNFPLAFSVAGGDTASALAAGNPVIIKAHPAHPGTSELVGQALRDSVRECGLPEGTFSLLFDGSTRAGKALVQHPLVKAVGFTGSRVAGRVLMDLAAARPEPIPFFGEMSSTNPVFILAGALRERSDLIAAGLHASFTMGGGQFCTKPGMVFLPEGRDAISFVVKLEQLVRATPQFTLLTAGIGSAYGQAIVGRKKDANVRVIAETSLTSDSGGFVVGATLFETDAQSFLDNRSLDAEIFGPATLLVRHSNRSEVLEIARKLEGHLTVTIHGTEQELREFADLVAILETKVGRLVFNGFPTGVEVCHAMVHGGPYPATSEGRSTSVGSQAIFRFARPVCYQGFPDGALPEELQNANPLRIWRMLDGEITRKAVTQLARSES